MTDLTYRTDLGNMPDENTDEYLSTVESTFDVLLTILEERCQPPT